MTPFGHAAVSYLAGKPIKTASLIALVAGGVLVDIDFIFLPFPWFNSIHHVLTHNLFFITLMGLCGALVATRSRFVVGLSLIAGGVLHLIFDSMMDNNPTNGLGIALFWPVSDHMFMLFNLVEPEASTAGWSDLGSMIQAAIKAIFWEVPLWILALLVLVKSNWERLLSVVKN